MRSMSRISRRTLFAPIRVLFWRLYTRNSSFARGKLLVIVCRSRRHSALLHSLVLLRSASLAYAKLRALRALRMTYRFFCGGGRFFSGCRGRQHLQKCVLFFHKSNIGERAGSRRSLTAIGSCHRQRTNYANFALNFGTRQRHPTPAKQALI